MISGNKQLWKEIGWNGLRISVPGLWETDRLGDCYILLANDGFPVLEAKWNKIKGKFSPDKHLKRLKSKHHKLQTNQEIFSWVVPRSWSRILNGFDITGFKWDGNLFSGKGLILFCKDCKRATLLQFYEHRHKKNSVSALIDYPGVLSSFQDHNSKGICLWSVFDIRAELPEQFKLVRHSFNPGSFELVFEVKDCQVAFYRWSPASVILFDHDLGSFARKVFPFETCDGVSEFWDCPDSIEFMFLPSLGFWKKWRQRLRKKKIFKWGRLWHISDANRILGVTAESKRPMDIDFLKNICSRYGIV